LHQGTALQALQSPKQAQQQGNNQHKTQQVLQQIGPTKLGGHAMFSQVR
jgi:hypothetical protein